VGVQLTNRVRLEIMY